MAIQRPIVVIEDRVAVPRTALEHAGYRDWVKSAEFETYPRSLRTTFVGGEIVVEMTPESIDEHNQVRAVLGATLGSVVLEHDLGTVYPRGALFSNESAGLSCDPDLTFVSWRTIEEGRVEFVPRKDGTDCIEILGSPDLVVEVVCPSSVRKDTRLLRVAYFRANIREYWLIDARGAEIRFEILVRGEHGFTTPDDPAGPQASHVLGGRWSLTRFRNRVGHWTYRLDRAA